MHPPGAAALGGAQVIRIGTSRGAAAADLASRTTAAAAGRAAAAAAAAVEQLLPRAQRQRRPHQVIVVAADAPRGAADARGRPRRPRAARRSCSSTPRGVPAGDGRRARSLHRPSIYVIGGAAAAPAPRCSELRHFGHVTAIAGDHASAAPAKPPPRTRSRSRASPTARSAGGSKNPATASCSPTPPARSTRPAAALLSASGEYGPLLLLESADADRRRRSAPISATSSRPTPPRPHSGRSRRLQSRLADRRRTRDLAGHAGRNRLAAGDQPEQAGRPKKPSARRSNRPTQRAT